MAANAVVRKRNAMMSNASVVIVSALCALGLFLMAWGLSARRRRRRLAREAAKGAQAGSAAGAAPVAAAKGAEAADPLARRLEQRVEALEGRLGEIGARLGSGNADEKLQAMAGSLLALVRDKNAAMETAMAGLDQLRARMRTLEQMGSNAEARGIFEGLAAGVDSTQAAQAAGEAALVARIAALEAAEPGAALAGQFNRLMEHDTHTPVGGREIGDVLAVLADGAGGGLQQADQNSQNGGLATAGGAQNGEELSVLNIEADPVQSPLAVEHHFQFFDDEFLIHLIYTSVLVYQYFHRSSRRSFSSMELLLMSL